MSDFKPRAFGAEACTLLANCAEIVAREVELHAAAEAAAASSSAPAGEAAASDVQQPETPDQARTTSAALEAVLAGIERSGSYGIAWSGDSPSGSLAASPSASGPLAAAAPLFVAPRREASLPAPLPDSVTADGTAIKRWSMDRRRSADSSSGSSNGLAGMDRYNTMSSTAAMAARRQHSFDGGVALRSDTAAERAAALYSTVLDDAASAAVAEAEIGSWIRERQLLPASAPAAAAAAASASAAAATGRAADDADLQPRTQALPSAFATEAVQSQHSQPAAKVAAAAIAAARLLARAGSASSTRTSIAWRGPPTPTASRAGSLGMDNASSSEQGFASASQPSLASTSQHSFVSCSQPAVLVPRRNASTAARPSFGAAVGSIRRASRLSSEPYSLVDSRLPPAAAAAAAAADALPLIASASRTESDIDAEAESHLPAELLALQLSRRSAASARAAGVASERFCRAAEACGRGAVLVDTGAPAWRLLYVNEAFSGATGVSQDRNAGGGAAFWQHFDAGDLEVGLISLLLRCGLDKGLCHADMICSRLLCHIRHTAVGHSTSHSRGRSHCRAVLQGLHSSSVSATGEVQTTAMPRPATCCRVIRLRSPGGALPRMWHAALAGASG